MKTLLFLGLLLACISTLRAQQFEPPESNSTIFLHSGKKMKDITLWRMDSMNLEYVIKGNLADVKKQDVFKIETPDFLIEFDEDNRMIKKGYDVIVLFTGDSLRGFIQEIGGEAISYQPVGGDKIKQVLKSEVASYSKWSEEGARLLHDSVSHRGSVRIIDQAPAEDDSTERSTALSNQDLSVVKQAKKISTDQDTYYHQSYERGVEDALADQNESAGWGGEGFVLGMTFGSPFLFLGAANSKVKVDKVPVGVDEKLYKEAYQNAIVKKRSKRAAAGAIAGKFLILIILIASM